MVVSDNNFIFPIIGKSRTLIYKILLSINIFGISLAIVSFFLWNKNIRLAGLFLLIFMAASIIWIIGNLIYKKFSIIGRAMISSQEISIKIKNASVTYSIKDISGLKITYFGSEGDSYNHIYIGALRLKDGANNFLTFKENNGTKHIYELFLSDGRKIKQLLLQWEKDKIPFELNTIS